MNVPVKADVRCSDEPVGESTCVIVDPHAHRLTDIVVRQRHFPHVQRRIPIERIASAAPGDILLDCAIADVADFEEFTETKFVDLEIYANADGERRHPGDRLLWPYVTGPTVLLRRERLADGEVAVHRGAAVEATDGRVGHIDDVLVDSVHGHITHIVVHKGVLWSAQDVAVPWDAVRDIGGDGVRLALSRDAFNAMAATQVEGDLRGTAAAGLVAEAPQDANVPVTVPDGAHLEASHLLANEAAEWLAPQGFTEEQILEWAEAYLVEKSSGDVDGLLAWIRATEGSFPGGGEFAGPAGSAIDV